MGRQGKKKSGGDFSKAPSTLCWKCKKAYGGCSWTEWDEAAGHPKFEPVPGWAAIPTILHGGYTKKGTEGGTPSCIVVWCPQHEEEPQREVVQCEAT